MTDEPATIVVNKHHKPGDINGQPPIYIGRGSIWGNPYKIGPGQDRYKVIEMYFHHLVNTPELLEALPGLVGRGLMCFCAPKPCHGDIIAAFADYYPELVGPHLRAGLTALPYKAEYRYSIEDDRAVELPDGTVVTYKTEVPAMNPPLEVPYSGLWRVRDGKVYRGVVAYQHLGDLIRTIGSDIRSGSRSL
jgi:hypothetical protein